MLSHRGRGLARAHLTPCRVCGSLAFVDPDGPPRGDGRTKELRLALVCYGGSSLAIYMHGVTKELNRLVKGSALLASANVDPSTGTPSEQVYAKLLSELTSHDDGVQTRVVVDVIAGTSAGGINGICLAKALTHNRSQDELRTLWFDHGNIDGLLNAPGWLKRRGAKLAWVAMSAVKREPLKGDVMAQWVFDAFSNMEAQEPEPRELPSLLPEGHKLDLFVTVTDFSGYGRQVPFTNPNPIVDTRHRHVLAFRYGGKNGQDDFGGKDAIGPLTFAARTTSCIPGVFPAVSFRDFQSWLDNRHLDVGRLGKKFFRHYELAGFPPEESWFVDGGVLDNKPFGPAIDSIRERPAGLEVDRRLLYLEPDPSDPQMPQKQSRPNTITAAIGGLTGLPRAEPILDDLVEIGALNERVERIKDIIQTSWKPIEDRVQELVLEEVGSLGEIPADPESPKLAQLRERLDRAGRTEAGFNYATYIRLKISGVVDRYAQTACAVCDLPTDTSHAQLARRVVRCWAEVEGLFQQDSIEPSDRQRRFLVDFDLDYAQRRIRFVIDGVSGWYQFVGRATYPSREDLDEVKARLWKAVLMLRDVMAGTDFDEDVRPNFEMCFPVDVMGEFMRQPEFDPMNYVDEHREELAALEDGLRTFLKKRLETFTSDLYVDLLKRTQDWDKQRKWALLSRYLGFQFWDVLLYPVQALSDVGERDLVEVVRLSPRDTKRIPSPHQNGHEKLVGAGQHHFGAFLSDRGGREKDYLWGRLDGAERLIDIVLPDSPEEDKARWCREAFRAILMEDERAVPNAADLVRHVRSALTA
jgi:patatin-related protein